MNERLHQLAFSDSNTDGVEAEGEAGACIAEVVGTLEVAAPCVNDVAGGAVGHGAARIAGEQGDHGASLGESDLEVEVTAIDATDLHLGASAEGSDKGDVVGTAPTSVASALASGASDDMPRAPADAAVVAGVSYAGGARADGENHDEG